MTQEASSQTVETEILTAKALSLRMRGATYRHIARTLDISVSTAHSYVTGGLEGVREHSGEIATMVRNIQLVRLDAMLRGLWKKRNEPRTADTLLRLMERQSKLVGADAPVRWEGSGPGGGPIPVQGDVDLSKLSTEQLRQLETILIAGGAPGTGLEELQAVESGPAL